MFEGDRLWIGIRDAKIEIGVDIRVQVQLALLDELHHRRPGKGLADGTNPKDGLFRIDGNSILDIGVAIGRGNLVRLIGTVLRTPLPVKVLPRNWRSVVPDRLGVDDVSDNLFWLCDQRWFGKGEGIACVAGWRRVFSQYVA